MAWRDIVILKRGGIYWVIEGSTSIPCDSREEAREVARELAYYGPMH